MIRRLLISVCVVLCSCQAFHVSEILDTAERQIVEYPDSALTTVRSIGRYTPMVPSVRARYSLLYSKALDKNKIRVNSDSLIIRSTNYYDLFGTPEERMESYYYLGRVQENAKEHLPATISYLYAEQFADVVDNNYLKGLLYSHLGEMYLHYTSYPKAVDYYTKSYEFYKLADLRQHQAYQLFSMGRVQLKLYNNELALSYILQAKELASTNDFDALLPFCDRELIGLYQQNRDYEKAYQTIENLDPKYYLNDMLALSSIIQVFHHLGYKERATQLLDRGCRIAQTKIDSAYMHYCLSQIYYSENKFKESIAEYNKWIWQQNSVITKHMEMNEISSIESVLFKKKVDDVTDRIMRLKIGSAVLIILVCLIFVCAYIGIKRKERRLSIELARNIALIEDIRSSIDHQSADISSMLHEVLYSRFEIFDKLCYTYYERNNGIKQQKAIYDKVQELIGDFSTNLETIADIENSVNICKDNAMAKLREEFPELKDEEYKLLCYVFAGFSNQAIAVFTNSESGTVATRKSRLKSKILNSNTPNRDLFKQLFG